MVKTHTPDRKDNTYECGSCHVNKHSTTCLMNKKADIQYTKSQYFPETFCFFKVKEATTVHCEAENNDAETDPISV